MGLFSAIKDVVTAPIKIAGAGLAAGGAALSTLGNAAMGVNPSNQAQGYMEQPVGCAECAAQSHGSFLQAGSNLVGTPMQGAPIAPPMGAPMGPQMAPPMMDPSMMGGAPMAAPNVLRSNNT